MAEQPSWSLSTSVREETVKRVTSNLIAMMFAEGGSPDEAQVAKTAASIERKAYTVAQVESTTTTGTRPPEEVLKAYTRCCKQWPRIGPSSCVALP